jgi:L-ascorbate metabolism protein UlaG (beta-lactamase superfamily)
MNELSPRLTYIGGPTALIEFGGVRFLTDPTFDPAGASFSPGPYTLTKTSAPAVDFASVGVIDAVLLSHDHHFDNLDAGGRAMLASAGQVLTTKVGAERLGGNAVGLEPWETIEIAGADGAAVRITATPARHGPEGGDRGPVIGFILEMPDRAGVYVSGDTVWYEGVAEVARQFEVRVAVLFMGAARVSAVGPAHLTFTADEGVEAARAFANAVIVPLHFEGWKHFSEGRAEIEGAFESAGLAHRLRWLEPGRPTVFE